MVEVKAQVIGGPVLLAGDIIQVTITITVPALDPTSSAQSSEVNEVVAWGSAQVHCVCTVNESRVGLSETKLGTAEEHAVTNATTSFAPWRGERGHLVLATKPKILFCDLQLLPGHSRSFLYREKLPMDAPPSHRGQLVKYAYKVTVGTQKLGSSISLLRLPIRVIVLPGLSDACIYSESEELGPSNPFVHTLQHETPRHTALQIIQNVSARKNVSQYNITNARGHVVRFTIYKTSFRLGEDILANFDFTAGKVPCIQYSVTLQSEEDVSEKYRKAGSKKTSLSSYSKTHEICLSFSHTHLLLPVPLHLTPTFSTDLVTLRWKLHFEFVLDVDGKDQSSTSDESEENTPTEEVKEITSDEDKVEHWSAPNRVNIETLVWDLPITIYPSSPNQLAQALGLTAHHAHMHSSSSG